MSKVIKVSDETHERIMALKGSGETVDDVLVRQLDKPEVAAESKWFIGVDEGSPDGDYSVLIRKEEDGSITVLDGHYNPRSEKNASEATPQSTRKVAGRRGAKDTFTPNDTPEPLEKPCCSSSRPCQHWQWDGNDMVYVNSLSSRRKNPEA